MLSAERHTIFTNGIQTDVHAFLFFMYSWFIQCTRHTGKRGFHYRSELSREGKANDINNMVFFLSLAPVKPYLVSFSFGNVPVYIIFLFFSVHFRQASWINGNSHLLDCICIGATVWFSVVLPFSLHYSAVFVAIFIYLIVGNVQFSVSMNSVGTVCFCLTVTNTPIIIAFIRKHSHELCSTFARCI